MKTRFIIIASVLLALTSCGTTASLSQAPAQKYQDGIYYRPQSLSLDAQAAQLTATDDLIARTKSSAVFVKTVGKVDTLFIPENMSSFAICMTPLGRLSPTLIWSVSLLQTAASFLRVMQ